MVNYIDTSTLKHIIMSACAVMLCACSSENGVDDVPVTPPTPPEPVEQLPIRISSMPEARALDNAFETGDRIGVFVVNRNADGSAVGLKTQGNYIDNSMYTFHGTWTSAVQEYWKDDITHADFYMYYPYTATIASVEALPWSVKTDQSAGADYKASELLIGKTLDVAPSEEAVNIGAKHMMAGRHHSGCRQGIYRSLVGESKCQRKDKRREDAGRRQYSFRHRDSHRRQGLCHTDERQRRIQGARSAADPGRRLPDNGDGGRYGLPPAEGP